jgi:hypothetical protein
MSIAGFIDAREGLSSSLGKALYLSKLRLITTLIAGCLTPKTGDAFTLARHGEERWFALSDRRDLD